MHSLIKRFAVQCLENEIIEEPDFEWFVYGLEKRIAAMITGSFFLLIAIIISNIWVACSYLGSFYFLRVRTNGYHAKSFAVCFFFSLLLEGFFLLAVLPLLNSVTIYMLNAVAFLIVFFLAPYNHPNMHLSADEVCACRKSARKRIVVLVTAAVSLFALGAAQISLGITLGNTMAALLLAVVNIRKGKGEKEHEKQKSER